MASRFWVGNDGTWDASDTTHWAATSGGAGGQTVPGSGDTVTIDAASGTGTITVNTDFNVTSVTCGAMTMTLDFSANNNSPTMQTFSGTGTGVRTINMGSGIWTLTGSGGSIWTTTTTTNLTLDPGTSLIRCTYSGGVGTRTISTTSNAPVYDVSFTAGTDIVALSTTFSAHTLSFSGFTGTVTSTTWTLSGSLVLGSGMTCTASSSVCTFTGTGTITSNGVSINKPVTINTSGTITLVGNLNTSGGVSGLLTLTAGTFDAVTYDVMISALSTSVSNTRAIIFGSGQWTVTGNSGTVWSMATITNLTMTPGLPVVFSYSGSVGTRTLTMGAVPEAQAISIKVTGGTDALSIGNSGGRWGTIDLTGFSGSWTRAAGGSIGTYGDLILGIGMTITTGTFGFTFLSASAAQSMTSSGVIWNAPLAVAGTGTSSFSLVDALVMTNALTLTSGIFNSNNNSITATTFAASGSGRTLNLGSSTFTLTGTGTVWSFASTATLDAGTSTIVLNDSTSATKTFSAGDTGTTGSYYNLVLDGTGTGTFVIGTTTAINTFNNITVSGPPHTVQVFAGKTINFSSITWSGTAGNINTFQSTTNGTPWFIVSTGGTVVQDYISLQDSWASGATFYAGKHSTDAGNNLNWIFTDVPPTQENAGIDQNYVKSLLATADDDGVTALPVYANPTNHSLKVLDGTTGSNFSNNIAPRDQNHIPALVALSSVDGVTPVLVYMDNDTHSLLIDSN